MTETKRDVVEAILLAKDTDTIWDSSTVRYYLNRYDAALPDDMPVIPKVVGEYIQERKAARDSLALALTARLTPDEVYEWIHTVTGDPDTELSQIEYVKQQDTFALAWLLGVWRVEETGKIVKLEAEK